MTYKPKVYIVCENAWEKIIQLKNLQSYVLPCIRKRSDF